MKKFVLKLFVTGETPSSKRALENLTRICENELNDEYEIKVIDILKNPQLAEDEKIIATPTLIKDLPPPIKRILGDMSDSEKVLIGLDLGEKLK